MRVGPQNRLEKVWKITRELVIETHYCCCLLRFLLLNELKEFILLFPLFYEFCPWKESRGLGLLNHAPHDYWWIHKRETHWILRANNGDYLFSNNVPRFAHRFSTLKILHAKIGPSPTYPSPDRNERPRDNVNCTDSTAARHFAKICLETCFWWKFRNGSKRSWVRLNKVMKMIPSCIRSHHLQIIFFILQEW